jgi:excisionase family DNA binding protein
MVQPVTMRAPEAARHIGVSLSLMKRWIAEKKVKSTAIGRVRLIFVDSLNALLDSGQS